MAARARPCGTREEAAPCQYPLRACASGRSSPAARGALLVDAESIAEDEPPEVSSRRLAEEALMSAMEFESLWVSNSAVRGKINGEETIVAMEMEISRVGPEVEYMHAYFHLSALYDAA